MHVFLSWSGDRSRRLADALHEFLPLVLHYVEPWVSSRDIDAGDRWAAEVSGQLEKSQFGLVCLTKDNLSAPWILFEAGALSKQLSSSAVIPYLLDVDFGDLVGPLAQFQAKKATRDSTLDVVRALNERSQTRIPDARMTALFDLVWPQLQEKLENLPKASGAAPRHRTTDEILDELVSAVRGFDGRLGEILRAPHRTTRSPTLAGRIMIHLEIATPLRSINDLIVARLIDGDGFLDSICRITGLQLSEYGSTWHVFNRASFHALTLEEGRAIKEYIAANPGQLSIVDIPF